MMTEVFLKELEHRAGSDHRTPIAFTADELLSLTQNDADEIIAHFDGQVMMRLPQWEVDFFEWVKTQDPTVWEDLWSAEPELYAVTIGFLPVFLEDGHGFPICDLVVEDNYYFHKDFVTIPDGTNLVGIIVEKIGRGEQVTANEAFLLEVMQHPIDVWRFSFKYNLPLEGSKKMVREYADDGVILHLTKNNEISDYLEL